MDDRDEVATALERPGGSAPDTSPEPEGPRPEGFSSAFDPPRERFETVSELGRGGMGRVDEAYDRALGRNVAIKHMLHPSGTELARFEREARITARLEHPGIVPIHDAGRTPDGTPYYVMRRVDGQPLSDLVKKRSLDERLALVPNVLAACDAVAFAHARNVVHRDIKPTNILIGPFGETLVIDWGLARELGDIVSHDLPIPSSGQSLTRIGTVAGTPGFMSPEQSRGEKVDQRADVFALGVTLFFVLAGTSPWRAASATEIVDHVGADRPPDWSLLPREIPADLRAIVDKAMTPDARERYADAGALAADLRRYITGNLVGAYEYGAFARLVRFVRRHRVTVAIAAASLVVIALVAVISIRRVIAERDDARAARALAEQRQREVRDVADALLVDNARQLAQTDTLAAIMTLRTLSPDSRRWPSAWTVAVEAYLRGIPFGFVTSPGSTSVQIDATGTYAVTYGLQSGELAVIDLRRRARRVVANVGRGFTAAWLEAGKTLVCNTMASGLQLVDVASGAVTPLGMQVATIASDRRGRVLVRDHEEVVHELTAAAPQPREIARGVKDLAASPDLGLVLLAFADRTEVRTTDRTYVLPAYPTTTSVSLRDRAVALTSGKTTTVWDLADDGPHVRLTFEHRGLVPSVLLTPSGGVSSVGVAGLRTILREGGDASIFARPFYGAFATGGGFSALDSEGGVLMRDRRGYFLLPRRAGPGRMVDESPDERFVVLTTGNSEVLVWDLAEVRGRTVPFGTHDTPAFMDREAVFGALPEGGVSRYPFAGGPREVLFEAPYPPTGYVFDEGQRWFAAPLYGQRAYVYDRRTSRSIELATPTSLVASSGDGVVYADAQGSIALWQPGQDGERREIAHAHGPLGALVARPDVIAGARDTELVRIDRATRAVTTATLPVAPDDIVLGASGVVWALGGGRLWRWSTGRAPVEVPTPEPVDSITTYGPTHVLLHSSKSLLVVSADGTFEAVPAAARRHVAVDDRLLAYAEDAGTVIAFDRVSRTRIRLPSQAMDNTLLAAAGRIGYVPAETRGPDASFTYWDLDALVPRDPAALQTWLRTVSNAQSVPDSDAIAWPTR